MNKFSLNALGAIILASAITFFGFVSPAQAVSPGSFNPNGSAFWSTNVFSYGVANTERPRVSFADNGFTNGTTYYVKLVGVTTSATSCVAGNDDMGQWTLPGGATVVARYGSGPYSYASTCTLTTSGSGASAAVIVATTPPAGLFSPVSGQLTFTTGLLTVDPAATDVKAYVSVDQSTWTQIGSGATIGYGFTLDANGGTVGGGGTTVAKSSSTSSWTATAAMNNNISRTGYDFLGWTTDAQNTGTLYASGATVPLTVSPITLYAKWQASVNQNNNQNNNNNNNNFTPCSNGSLQSQYMLQVMGNQGRTSGNAGDCLYRSAQAATVAPANPFTRSGYTFTGWKTAQNVAVAVGEGVTATVGTPFQLYAVWAQNSSSNSGPRPTATLGLTLNRGARVAQAPAPVTASGLQPNAAYTVEVHSTPVIIASGNVASDGTVNYTAAIPSGLEAGWHTMIFTSTAADGTSFTSTYYFKVAGDGTLLSTSDTIPAELAYTGTNTIELWSFLAAGISLALVGAELIMVARRKRSN